MQSARHTNYPKANPFKKTPFYYYCVLIDMGYNVMGKIDFIILILKCHRREK